MIYLNDLGERNEILIKSWKLDNFSYLYQKQKNDKKICVNIDLNNYHNFNNFFAILRDVMSVKKDLSDVTFFITLKNELFSVEEFENIKKFNRILKTQNSKLYIKEFEVLWEIDEVQKTYDYILNIISEISSKNLSPLEQFLYAYKKVGENVYKDDNSLKSVVTSHSIFSLQNNGNIVCRSYSKMLSEIIGGLKNNDLICYENNGELFNEDDKFVGSHSMNIVILKDDKYKVNGIYSADCTWDSSDAKAYPICLTYCLIPLEDLKFYKGTLFYPEPKNNFQYLLADDNSTCLYEYQNKITLDILKKQHVLDIEEERQNYKNYILQNEPNKARFLNTTPFSDEILEYRFVKSLCNKIKQKSTVIDYTSLENALITVLKSQNILDANEYAEKILDISKKRSLHNYIYGAKNCVYTTSKQQFDRKKVIAEEMARLKQKHKEIQEKKKNKQKDRTLE